MEANDLCTGGKDVRQLNNDIFWIHYSKKRTNLYQILSNAQDGRWLNDKTNL